MKNELIAIKGVRGRLDANGNPELNLEDVARGLGFTQRQNKNGKTYKSVRWERVREYLSEFGVPTSGYEVPPQVGEYLGEFGISTSGDGDFQPVGKDGLPDFIPENIFYKLCFKASNETARKFQDVVTDEVLPAIRKHGAYLTPAKIEEVLLNPDTIIHLAEQLKAEQAARKRLADEVERKDQIIGELLPKSDYVDFILSSSGSMSTTQIAADYGLSANRLNKILREERIQRNVGGQWILYREHMGKGYTQSETIPIKRSDGRPDTKLFTKWTQKGRLMINDVLNRRGIFAESWQSEGGSRHLGRAI